MRVVWTPEAERDRGDIWLHISADNPAAAVRVDAAFSDAARSLRDLPARGRPGRAPGTRELIPLGIYRLVYEVRDDTVWILALVHTARLWPPEVS
ncbi:type II toxin-antitoxin system RelE/ParE family toxin [Phenylobacterium sp.]|uniref:type II toxin-antitoxin system RelE/ParE family toxin n=1 Tax=Phenylobacterium sp. TaxID=1871053 RepID=UPI0037CC810B